MKNNYQDFISQATHEIMFAVTKHIANPEDSTLKEDIMKILDEELYDYLNRYVESFRFSPINPDDIKKIITGKDEHVR